MQEVYEIAYVLFITFLIYSGLGIANIIFGVLNSVTVRKENFEIKKLMKGIGKALGIYIATALVVYAFFGLPYLNLEAAKIVSEPLVSPTAIEGLSIVGILSTIGTAIVHRGKLALTNITNYYGNKEEM